MSAAPERNGTTSEVLLTGATGFVGAFVLRALLRNTSTRVHCLVRGASGAVVHDRLRAAQSTYGLGEPDLARIVPVAGDLAAPDLGLRPARFRDLAGRVTTVIHAGAEVNLVKPPRMLEAANVVGTQAVLRLAREQGAMVHFLSTSEVFGPAPGAVDEDTAPEGVFAAVSGYGQTKRAGELAVLEAGFPAMVHRLDRIVGDHATGACQPGGDDFWLLVRTAMATGVLPDASVNVTPVDFAADAILALASTASGGDRRITHICHPRPVPMADLAVALCHVGRPVDVVPLPEWSAAVEELGSRPGGDPAARLLSVIAGRVLGGSPRFLAPRTTAALAGLGLHCPPVDVPALSRYVQHLTTTGFWSAAEPEGRRVAQG